MSKAGRNDPCPCGSGRKYKKCCYAKDQQRENQKTPPPHQKETTSSQKESEDLLIDKLKRIEALFAGTDHEGERVAAEKALDRIKERLRKIREIDPPTEYKFSMGDMWSRRLFVSLCRRYGIDTYRYSGQKYTTVMALVSKSFVDETLWPEFQELNNTLREYIDEITNRVIQEIIHEDSSEVEVRQEKRFISSRTS